MKKRIIIFVICFVSMAVLPLVSVKSENIKDEVVSTVNSSFKENNAQSNLEENRTESKTDEKTTQSVFKILDEDNGKIITVDDKTFCIGATAAEVPPSFEKEALKAQCIACYTHFCKLREDNRKNPDSKLKGADFSAKLSQHQYYIDNDSLKTMWGSLYNNSYDKINSAVNEVFGKVLTNSSGNLITVAYHAISGGATENCADVFGSKNEYLQAVASPGDTTAPGYLSKCSFTSENFKNKILSENNKADFSSSPNKWVGKSEKTESGFVKNIKIGGIDINGTTIRELFSLRSADFDLSYENGNFNFTVRGYGHGVGMSQYGAEYMAQQGADYKEILLWYYSGAKIGNLK